MGAGETVTVPRCPLVRHTPFGYYLFTLGTVLSIILLVAVDANDFLVTWYKTLASDWLVADLAAEALLVPLLAFVLILLHSCSKDGATAVALWREFVIMTVATVDLVKLGSEGQVNK